MMQFKSGCALLLTFVLVTAPSFAQTTSKKPALKPTNYCFYAKNHVFSDLDSSQGSVRGTVSIGFSLAVKVDPINPLESLLYLPENSKVNCPAIMKQTVSSLVGSIEERHPVIDEKTGLPVLDDQGKPKVNITRREVMPISTVLWTEKAAIQITSGSGIPLFTAPDYGWVLTVANLIKSSVDKSSIDFFDRMHQIVSFTYLDVFSAYNSQIAQAVGAASSVAVVATAASSQSAGGGSAAAGSGAVAGASAGAGAGAGAGVGAGGGAGGGAGAGAAAGAGVGAGAGAGAGGGGGAGAGAPAGVPSSDSPTVAGMVSKYEQIATTSYQSGPYPVGYSGAPAGYSDYLVLPSGPK